MNNPKKKRRTRSDKGVKRGSRKVEEFRKAILAPGKEFDEFMESKMEPSKTEKVSLNDPPECVRQAMKELVDEINEGTPPQMIVVDLPINRRLVLLKDENGKVYNGDVKDNRVYRRGQFVQVRKQRDGRVLVLGGRALNRV